MWWKKEIELDGWRFTVPLFGVSGQECALETMDHLGNNLYQFLDEDTGVVDFQCIPDPDDPKEFYLVAVTDSEKFETREDLMELLIGNLGIGFIAALKSPALGEHKTI